MTKHTLSLRLQPDLYTRLQARAHSLGIPLSGAARQLLQDGVANTPSSLAHRNDLDEIKALLEKHTLQLEALVEFALSAAEVIEDQIKGAQ